MKFPPALMMFVLKLPHRPLSALTMITSVLLSAPRGRLSSSGWSDASTRTATLASTRCICTAKGRAFMIRSWARRSFDAATIFIALVICCVFFTARMRRRRSISDGIDHSSRGCGLSRREVARELLHGGSQRGLQLIVELFLLRDATEQIRVAIVDELMELGLECPHVRDGDAVEISVGAGEDDRHLAFDRQRLVLRL